MTAQFSSALYRQQLMRGHFWLATHSPMVLWFIYGQFYGDSLCCHRDFIENIHI
ncbi:hypothetical protein JCM19238_3506 [Vibrio ponticus]|nr:hypothetical protein JCM19238_3506 [Vibrio ponticus]